MGVKQLRSIYQLKVTLNGSKPPIWRRLLVPGNINLGSFHIVLQIVMGWTNSHLHQFILGRTMYGIPDDEFGGDFGLEIEDENKYKLSQLLKKEKDSLKYEYDFGDGWEHKIILEKILPYESSVKVPSCIKGKRACPPEDCGGIWGYQDLIEVINDTSHPEHEEMLEWLGGDFDPEYFDVNEINEILSKYTR
jgi:hypothetical protein